MKNKITKKERTQIIAILLGISVYSIMFQPLQNLISKFGLSDFWLITFGLLFLLGVYKFFNII